MAIKDSTESWVKAYRVNDMIKPSLVLRTATDNNAILDQYAQIGVYGSTWVKSKALLNSSLPGMRIPGILSFSVSENLDSVTQSATFEVLNALPVSNTQTTLTSTLERRWHSDSIYSNVVRNGRNIPTELFGDYRVGQHPDPTLVGDKGQNNTFYREENLVFRRFYSETFTCTSLAGFPDPAIPTEEAEGNEWPIADTGAGAYFVQIDNEVVRVVQKSGNTLYIPSGGRAQNGLLEAHGPGSVVKLLGYGPYTGEWAGMGYLDSSELSPSKNILRPGTCLVSYEGYGDLDAWRPLSKGPYRYWPYAFTGYWFVRSAESSLSEDGIPKLTVQLLSTGYILSQQKITPEVLFSSHNTLESWSQSAFNDIGHNRKIPGDWVDYNSWDPSLKGSYPMKIKTLFAQNKAFFDHMQETEMGRTCEICFQEWAEFVSKHDNNKPIEESRAVGKHIFKESIRVFNDNSGGYSAGPMLTYVRLMIQLAIAAWEHQPTATSLAQKFTKMPNELYDNLKNLETSRTWNARLSFTFNSDNEDFPWDNQPRTDNATYGTLIPVTCPFESEYDRQDFSQPIKDYADVNNLTFQITRDGFIILKPVGIILRPQVGGDPGEWFMSYGSSISSFNSSLDVDGILTLCYVTGQTALNSEFTIAAGGTSFDASTGALLWHSSKVGNKEALQLTANVQQVDSVSLDNQQLGLDWNTKPEGWGLRVIRDGEIKQVYKKPELDDGTPPLRKDEDNSKKKKKDDKNRNKRVENVQALIVFLLQRRYMEAWKNVENDKKGYSFPITGEFNKNTQEGVKRVQRFLARQAQADGWQGYLKNLDDNGEWNHLTYLYANTWFETTKEFLKTDIWWYVQNGITWDEYVLAMTGVPLPQRRDDQTGTSKAKWVVDQLALKKAQEDWQKQFLHQATNVGNKVVDTALNKSLVKTISTNMADPRIELGDVIWCEVPGTMSFENQVGNERPPFTNGIYVTDISRSMDLQQGSYTATYTGYRFRGESVTLGKIVGGIESNTLNLYNQI